MHRRTALPALCVSILLSGCTNKMEHVNDTIVALYDSHQDVSLSSSEVENLPYASAYVRLDDQRQIFVVLAFVDNLPGSPAPRLSWIAADRAMIVTEQGRIIKTIGLEEDNLVELEMVQAKPAIWQQQNWQANYSWSPQYRYAFSAEATSEYLGTEPLTSSQWQLETRHYRETINYPALERTIYNEYWLDSKKQVVKTIQYLGPDMTRIEMTFVKPYAATQ